MNFSITANVKYTVEQRRLLRNSCCLSAGSDSLYLQFKPTIWAKFTHANTPTALPCFKNVSLTPLRYAEKQLLYWNRAT